MILILKLLLLFFLFKLIKSCCFGKSSDWDDSEVYGNGNILFTDPHLDTAPPIIEHLISAPLVGTQAAINTLNALSRFALCLENLNMKQLREAYRQAETRFEAEYNEISLLKSPAKRKCLIGVINALLSQEKKKLVLSDGDMNKPSQAKAKLKQAYHQLANKFHPDRNVNTREEGKKETEALFKVLNEAHEGLQKILAGDPPEEVVVNIQDLTEGLPIITTLKQLKIDLKQEIRDLTEVRTKESELIGKYKALKSATAGLESYLRNRSSQNRQRM
jgi:hypothetical protein